MKKFYTTCYTCILICFLSFTSGKINAQTTLVAGDIAFTGYISAAATTDEFSFVLLKNITAGTVINFTDNAWLSSNAFRVGEQTVTWTSGVAMVAGTEIKISGPGAGAATATLVSGATTGTCTGTMTSLSTSGDQVLAYQGTAASPTFIAAIHMNVYSTDLGDCANTTAATWDPTCIDGAGGTVGNTSMSIKPAALTTGTNCIWIGTQGVGASEVDNARFNCSGNLTTVATARAAINNSANWITSSGAPVAPMQTPSGCGFLGVVPVLLIDFNGKLNSDKSVTLNWEVNQQIDINEYVIEKSADGVNFNRIGAVPAGPNSISNKFSYTDRQVAGGANYYRLRIVELSGKMDYSEIVKITFKPTTDIILYPNPVKDKLIVQQFGSFKNKTAILADGFGKVLQQVTLSSQQQTINMFAYPSGIYLLKMDDGSVYKILKQ